MNLVANEIHFIVWWISDYIHVLLDELCKYYGLSYITLLEL